MSKAEAITEVASNLAAVIAAVCGDLLDTLEKNEENDDTRSPWELRYVLWSAYERCGDSRRGWNMQ